MRISDGISDVCSSDLHRPRPPERDLTSGFRRRPRSLTGPVILLEFPPLLTGPGFPGFNMAVTTENQLTITLPDGSTRAFEGPVTGAEVAAAIGPGLAKAALAVKVDGRSEEHTSELQSLMRISYAVFCLQKKNKHTD